MAQDKRNLWMIENVSAETRLKVKTFAVSHELTIAQALTRLVDLALSAEVKGTNTKQSGTHIDELESVDA